MYQNDPYLDELLRKPLLMAVDDDDEYDEYDDDDDEYEDEDDLFGDDILQAAIDEREAEEAEAEAFAASLLGGQEDNIVSPETTEEAAPAQKWFTRPGIRRHFVGYAILSLLGFIPLVLLFVYKISTGSLSSTMTAFSLALLVGICLSFYNVFYHFQHSHEFTVSFNVRSFFRFWPEVIVMSVVLLSLGFWNMSQMSNGTSMTLSGEPLVTYNPFAPQSDAEAPIASEKPAASEDVDTDIKYQDLLKKPIAGGAVGLVGASDNIPKHLLPAGSTMKIIPVDTTHENSVINGLFFGGSLTAAFGYAFVFGLAGLVFGLVRKFDTPISKKYLETINIETGEVKPEGLPYVRALQPLDVVFRGWLGFTFGSTLGFLVGAAVTVPLFILFKSGLGSIHSAPLLTALGVINYPDLAFSNAITLSALMVPFFLLAIKAVPQGYSVSEEVMRQHYEIRPTGHFVSAEQMSSGAMGAMSASAEGGIPSPAIINFGPLSEALETDDLMEELDGDEESLTKEIVDEFGREFEQIFGIDTKSLITKRSKKQQVDQRVLASALDESFGELGNVPVEISAELGQVSLPVTEWLNLKEGTLVLLDKPANEEIDILFNGVRKGKGKIVVSENVLSVKVSQAHFANGNGNHKREIRV